MERKKRYIAIRKEARDTVNGGPGMIFIDLKKFFFN